MKTIARQQCMNPACNATFEVTQTLTGRPKCGELLDIRYDWSRAQVPKTAQGLRDALAQPPVPAGSFGGVAVPGAAAVCRGCDGGTIGEGQTLLQNAHVPGARNWG